MKQHGTISLFQYWDRLRGGRAAPRRTEIEPADIKSMLADTFILEKDARGAAVFRLAGTRLCATYGRELKGFAFASLWAQGDQRLAAQLTMSAFADKAPSVARFDGYTRQGRSVAFEMLLLPLDGGTDNPRTLGSIAPFERPFWLGTDPVIEGRMNSMRMIDPEREPVFLAGRTDVSVPPLEPTAENLDGGVNAAAPRRFRHLVVIEGGRDE